MFKDEIRNLLDEGSELGWTLHDSEYWLLPVWNKECNPPHIEPTKAFFVVIENGVRKIAKEYDSLDAIILDGYDLEKMCDDSNPTFSY